MQKLDNWRVHQNRFRTVLITGPLGSGKSDRVRSWLGSEDYIWFNATKVDTLLQLEQLKDLISRSIEIDNEPYNVEGLFETLRIVSETHEMYFVIDEFQNFLGKDSKTFLALEKLIKSSRLKIILISSELPEVDKLLSNSSILSDPERIYRINDEQSSFSEFLKEKDLSISDKLFLYSISGGKENKLDETFETKFVRKNFLRKIAKKNSSYSMMMRLELNSLFGKESPMNNSILYLLAHGISFRGELESRLGRNVGGYLERLEEDCMLINRIKPAFAGIDCRNQKYAIKDLDILFWYRYLFNDYHQFYSKIESDYNTLNLSFEGFLKLGLIHVYKEKLAKENIGAAIAPYWIGKRESVSDLVVINENQKVIKCTKVSVRKKDISMERMRFNMEHLFEKFPEYTFDFSIFTLSDLE